MPKHPGGRREIQTDRQRKLLKLITDNFGKEKPLSMYDMMLAAGFSDESARQQSNILAGIREELEPIVRAMNDHRENVIKEMVKKMPKAKYRDLTDALDKLTKNIQLLSGRKTANDQIHITWEQ